MKHFPNAVFTDSVGSSETGFQGTGLQDASALSTDGPVVSIPPTTVILGDDNQILDPVKDVGRIGRTARSGNVPVGYYKDPEKSAKTFIEIDGVRYSIPPGDNARIEEGNRITLLGRGSNCINTGGEKVYPEEVEQAIKAHPGVYDVLVVGLPDEKYGQTVAAVVEERPGHTVELEELRTFLRAHLSGYKLPRALTIVPEIPRNATGKAQYPQGEGDGPRRPPVRHRVRHHRRSERLMRTPLCDAFGIEYPIFAFTPVRARRGGRVARRWPRRPRLRPFQRPPTSSTGCSPGWTRTPTASPTASTS